MSFVDNLDCEYCSYATEESIRREAFEERGLWQMADGRYIYICNMTTEHLVNCINKCRRNRWRIWALPLLVAELIIRRAN